MKVIVGITGGSGCGKSSVSEYLKKQGAFVIDADAIAREIVEPDKPALEEIKNAFFDDVILPDGTMDRKKVAQIVFSDKEKLDILNKITHKYIIEEIKHRVSKNDGLIIIDAALLFQTELYKLCDKTIAVCSDDKTRIERIIKRDNISKDLAMKRIASQDSEEYYKKRADFILDNSQTLKELEMKAEKILKEIM